MKTQTEKIEELKAEIRQARDNGLFGIAQQSKEELDKLLREQGSED